MSLQRKAAFHDWGMVAQWYVRCLASGRLQVRIPLQLLHWDRAVRRRHSVGGGAPVNFGRRGAASPKKSAVAARRGRPKTFFFKIHEKILFYPQNFLRNFFSHQSFEV